MKKLIFLLCMIPSFVFAQQLINEVRTISCVDKQSLNEFIGGFDEYPFIRALNVPVLGVQQYTPLVIFVNPKTKSFTIVEKISEERYCILALGGNFEPMPAEVIKEFNKDNEKRKL